MLRRDTPAALQKFRLPQVSVLYVLHEANHENPASLLTGNSHRMLEGEFLMSRLHQDAAFIKPFYIPWRLCAFA